MVEIDPADEGPAASNAASIQVLQPRVHSRVGSAPQNHPGRVPKEIPNTKEPPLSLAAAASFGGAAAVLYTMANIALRYCVGVDAVLVSAVKAVPTVVILGPFLAWMLMRGQRIATSYRMVPRFVVASLIGQFIGNVAFQVSLGVIGLAASVPITLGTLIIGGSILGKVILGEPVRRRTIIAMVTLIVAVVVLSIPTEKSQSLLQSNSSLPVWVGALCAAASGAAYSLFGVIMRQTLNGGLSSPATMFISGAVGTTALGTAVLVRIGLAPLELIAMNQWGVMIAAGALNFAAFAALALSLKSLPVVAVNLINASQVAMAAVAGVILFSEPVTVSLLVGIALTIAGLITLANGRRFALRWSR